MRNSREVEADFHLLEVITTVANSVHEPLNAKHIGSAAIDALFDHFHPLGACLHTADPIQQAFHLLCFHTSTESECTFETLQYVPYNTSMFIAQARLYHEAFFIEDMHAALIAGLIEQDDPLALSDRCGVVCVPLWFGDRFEGLLTVIFQESIHVQDPEIHALERGGTHIAAALAHARLHTTVENERTRLRVVLDQLPEGILITEASNGLISYANASAEHLLNIPLADLVGTSLDRHLQTHPETDQKSQNMPPWNFAIVRALAEETVKAQETVVMRYDGSSVVSLCSSAPLFSANGTLTGAVLVFQDITIQKSLEQHKNEFLSMTSHELRTPITAIQGLAEILQMNNTQNQHLDASRSQRALRQIVEQSQHLTKLIEEMLDLSRIEQTRFKVNPAPIDVLGLLLNVVESQAMTTRRHHLHVNREGLDTASTLIANVDAERLMQVFNNLISNAIKYSPVGGNIEIGLRPIINPSSQTPHEVLIWVKDQGIGIAPEEIPHIFKRFHRASTLNSSLVGLGIGLYLVKEIMTSHSGRVWVESVEGDGSTFYLLLPLNANGTK